MAHLESDRNGAHFARFFVDRPLVGILLSTSMSSSLLFSAREHSRSLLDVRLEATRSEYMRAVPSSPGGELIMSSVSTLFDLSSSAAVDSDRSSDVPRTRFDEFRFNRERPLSGGFAVIICGGAAESRGRGFAIALVFEIILTFHN